MGRQFKPGQLQTGSLYNISSSYAVTASYAANAGGSSINTGSFVTTASFNAFTASYGTGSFTGSFTGLLTGTASWANNSVTASYVQTAQTASYVLNAVSASYVNSLHQQIILSGSLKLDPTQDPDPSGSDLDSTVLFQSSSNTALGYDLYVRQNGNLVKWKWIEGSLETGLLYGGAVTYSGSNVFVSPGSGIIAEHNATTGSEVSPMIEYVTWNAITQSIANIATQQVTYLYIDNTGTLQQQSTRFTSQQYHTYIPLGAVGHFDYTQVSAFGGGVQTAYDQISQISNFVDAFGPLKMSGYGLTGQAGSLRLSVGAGTSFIHGGFYQNDPEFPSQITTPSQATASLARVQRSGSAIEFDTNAGNFYTVVNPTQYDRDGDGTLASVGSGNWTIQRVFIDPKTGVLYVYYGQARYTSLLNALQYLPTDPFTEGDTFDFTTFVGFLVLKGNASNIADTANNSIINGGLFRGSGQGSGGGIALSNLDDLTDVSIVSPTNGQALIYDSGIWQNGVPTSSSYALTASYLDNYIPPFPFTGSARITGSLSVTGSASILAFTGSSANIFTIRNSANTDNLLQIKGNKEFTLASALVGDGFSTYLSSQTGVTQITAAGNSLALYAAYNINYNAVNQHNIMINGVVRAFMNSSGYLGIGQLTPTARLDVLAQGALSTDIAFRVRNSADTVNLASIQGDGVLNLAYLADTSRIAINSTTSGQAAIAIGSGNSGLRTVSVGYNNDASGQDGVVIGQGNTAASAGSCGIIVGYNNNHTNGIVVGKSNSGSNSLIFGNSNSIGGSGATNNNVIAIGNGMTETSGNAKLPHTFMFGSYATTGNKAGLSFRSNNINHLLLGYDIMDSSYSNTSGSNWMGFKSGSLPVQSPNTFKIWASGSVGNVKPYFITENGTTIWLGDESRLFNVTASSITSSFTGSLLGTASYATQALSASFAPSSPAFPFTGSALITGSLGVTGSASILAYTASAATIFNVRNSANSANLLQINGDSTAAFGSTIYSNAGLTLTGTKQYNAYFEGGTTGIYVANNLSANTSKGIEVLSRINNLAGAGVSSTGVTTTADGGSTTSAHYGIRSNAYGSGTNYGGYFDVVNGVSNYAIVTQRGFSGFGQTAPAAMVDIKAAGALSTDVAFRVRNSANSANILTVLGTQDVFIGSTTTPAGVGHLFNIRNGGSTSIPFAYFDNASFNLDIDRFCNIKFGFGLIGVTSATHTLLLGTGSVPTGRNSGQTMAAWTAISQGTNDSGFVQTGGDTSSNNAVYYNYIGKNWTLGGITQGNGKNVLALITGSAPTNNISSSFQLYASTGSLTNNTRPHIRTGNGTVVWLGDESRLFNVTASNMMIGATSSLALFTSVNSTVNVGTTTIYAFPTASYDGVFIDYTARSGSNARAGQLMGIWSGSAVNYTETTTTDFGSTSAITFGMSVSASSMIVSASATTAAWSVKTIIRSM
jgi:hypothetical protein